MFDPPLADIILNKKKLGVSQGMFILSPVVIGHGIGFTIKKRQLKLDKKKQYMVAVMEVGDVWMQRQ